MKNKTSLFTVLLFVLFAQFAFAQTKEVSGVVKATDTGDPLPGVAILEKGTTNGGVTDFDGKFSIKVAGPNAILQFSSMGMETQEVKVGSNDFLVVNLKLEKGILDEVTVTALGISRETKTLGYSATTVKGEDVTEGGDRSVLNGIQGKVAGVNITSASGDPGSSSRVIIRGIQSIGGGNGPLFVIDGVPMVNSSTVSGDNLNSQFDFGNGANAINPDDVENISVLKGSAATSLYGSDAANGAIIITTKKGKAGPNGKPGWGVSYSGNVTFTNPLRLPELQNTYGQGWDKHHWLDENGSWGPAMDGRVIPWGRVIDNSQLLKPYSPLENNLKDFFETGVTWNNSISVGGAEGNSTFYASFANVNQDGIYPTNVDRYNRNTVSLRAGTKIKKLSLSGSVNFADEEASFVVTGQGTSAYNNLMQFPRDLSVVDHQNYHDKYYNINDYFTQYGVTNPYWSLNEDGNDNRNEKFYGNMIASLDLMDNLKLTYRFGYDITNTSYKIWKAILLPEGPNDGSVNDPGKVTERTINRRLFNHDIMLNYDKKISENLKFDALLGFNINERTTADLTSSIVGLDIPGFYNLSNSSSSPSTSTNFNIRRAQGVYLRAGFGYKEFLFLNLNGRNDWSSTLPKDNNAFFYPAANMSLVFTELIEKNNYLDFGKLRLGYGLAGNDPTAYQIDAIYSQRFTGANDVGVSSRDNGVYQPFRRFNFPLPNQVNGFTVGNRIGNLNLSPEITSEFEIGVDLRFFKGRFNVDYTYYNRVTDDQILNTLIAPSSGYTNLTKNVAKVENKGHELLVTVGILRDWKNFNWNVSVNYTKNNNKVLKISDDINKLSLGGTTQVGFFAVEGQPIGVFEGSVPERDPNGNIVVDANGVPVASTEKEYYGNAQNDYILGINNSLSWKNISLGFTFDFREGGLMFSRTADITTFTGNGVKTLYNDRRPFVVPGSVIKVDNGDGSFSYVENHIAVDPEHFDDYNRGDWNDRSYVIDRSYVKLREVSLTYKFPKSLLNKSFVQSLSFSVIGRNLFVWTPVENQFVDPEVTSFGNGIEAEYGEYSANPTVRSIGFAILASF